MRESVDEKIARMKATPGTKWDQAFETWVRGIEAKNRHHARNDLREAVAVTTIAGGLACWAYWSIPHALLFAWIGFSVFAVGNRVIDHLRADKFESEKNVHLDRLYGPEP